MGRHGVHPYFLAFFPLWGRFVWWCCAPSHCCVTAHSSLAELTACSFQKSSPSPESFIPAPGIRAALEASLPWKPARRKSGSSWRWKLSYKGRDERAASCFSLNRAAGWVSGWWLWHRKWMGNGIHGALQHWPFAVLQDPRREERNWIILVLAEGFLEAFIQGRTCNNWSFGSLWDAGCIGKAAGLVGVSRWGNAKVGFLDLFS